MGHTARDDSHTRLRRLAWQVDLLCFVYLPSAATTVFSSKVYSRKLTYPTKARQGDMVLYQFTSSSHLRAHAIQGQLI